MNQQPYQLNSPHWEAKLSPWFIRATRWLRKRHQRQQYHLKQINVQQIASLQSLIEQDAGILVTPNHPSHADFLALLEAGDRVDRPFYFMTAWQVFAMARWWECWLYQRYGCFSIEREGTDIRAFKKAVRILTEEPYPLIIFPEGDVYHLNDRVTPFYEGPAAIALTAIRLTDRPIYILPCALKFHYIQKPYPELEDVMCQLEKRIFWRPRRHQPLSQRIYQFAQAIIALKEYEYLQSTQPGSLPQRIRNLMEHILQSLENYYGLKTAQNIPERVKNARRACLEQLLQVDGDLHKEQQIRSFLEDIFLVVQLYSYPGDYVHEHASIERLAETIDKFEEDVLEVPTAGIRGVREGTVLFGEPIDIRDYAKDYAKPRQATRPLTDTLEKTVQQLLNQMNSQ